MDEDYSRSQRPGGAAAKRGRETTKGGASADAQRVADGAGGAGGASPGERGPDARTRGPTGRERGARSDPRGAGRGAQTRAVLYAIEVLGGRAGAVAPPDAAARIAEACAVSQDTATRALREAQDRLDWAVSADPGAAREAWIASVGAVASDAIAHGRHEAALAALEMRARATGIIAAPAAAQVAVSVGAGAGLDASGLARELEAAQDELRRLAAARAARALPPPGAAQGATEIDRAREGGGVGDGGGGAA